MYNPINDTHDGRIEKAAEYARTRYWKGKDYDKLKRDIALRFRTNPEWVFDYLMKEKH